MTFKIVRFVVFFHSVFLLEHVKDKKDFKALKIRTFQDSGRGFYLSFWGLLHLLFLLFI